MHKIQDSFIRKYTQSAEVIFISLGQKTKYSFADKMCWTWVPGEWRTEKRSSCGNIIVDFQLSSLQNSLLIRMDKCKNYETPNHVNSVLICGLMMCAHNLSKSPKTAGIFMRLYNCHQRLRLKRKIDLPGWTCWLRCSVYASPATLSRKPDQINYFYLSNSYD